MISWNRLASSYIVTRNRPYAEFPFPVIQKWKRPGLGQLGICTKTYVWLRPIITSQTPPWAMSTFSPILLSSILFVLHDGKTKRAFLLLMYLSDISAIPLSPSPLKQNSSMWHHLVSVNLNMSLCSEPRGLFLFQWQARINRWYKSNLLFGVFLPAPSRLSSASFRS